MNVERLNIRFSANPKKVILQFFLMNKKRTANIINRILSIEESVVKQNLENVYSEFISKQRVEQRKKIVNRHLFHKRILN